MNRQIIIFSHYGVSDYLNYTLACAKKTNPLARLIFLGDAENKEIAEKNGWEHYCFENYKGPLNCRFDRSFKHIQGRYHDHIKNGKDWLRYVFERWFFIENFVSEQNIKRFWHFDSDTMILSELDFFFQTLSGFEFTVQCNDTCLNGLINSHVISAYCEHICYLFESPQFLANQQHEFDTVNPMYAFTEMRAFDDFKDKSNFKYANLMLYNDEYVFDDCICQEHGFEMTKLLNGRNVKDVHSDNGVFFGFRDNEQIKFATLNLSWVPLYIFRWVLETLDLKGQFSLKSAYPNFREALLLLRSKLKRVLQKIKYILPF